jgi:hypothetical protein
MRGVLSAVGAVAVLAIGAITPAGGQEAEDPAHEILAVLSPIAAPACLTVGLSTVLVPLVGDQLGSALGGAVDVTSVLQQATGPVLVACGSFPAADGTRCALVDGPIELIWPAQLSDVGVQPLAPLGGAVEALTKLIALLGLPDLGLQPVLGCSIPVAPDDGVGEPVPPPAFAPDQGPIVDPAPSMSGTSGLEQPTPAGTVQPVTAPGSLDDVLTPTSAIPASAGLRGPILALAALIAGGLLWSAAKPRSAPAP